MLVLVHQLDGAGRYQLTVLNFANQDIGGTVRSEHLPPGGQVSDMFSGKPVAVIDDLFSFAVHLQPYQGMSLLVEAPAEDSVAS